MIRPFQPDDLLGGRERWRGELLVAWLLLAGQWALECRAIAATPTPASESSVHAVEAHRFSFESNDDKNYDNQPDEWMRRQGAGFPHYVRAEIDRKISSHGHQSLRFDLNGGQAVYYSPLINVDVSHSYILRGKVRAEGLQQNAALLSLSLLDHRRQRIRRVLSRPVTGTNAAWVTLDVGPVSLEPAVRFVVIGCHIVEGAKNDVRGRVWFDDLWLARLPRLMLSTGAGLHYFHAGDAIEIHAEVKGLAEGRTHALHLALEDSEGKTIANTRIPIAGRVAHGPQLELKTDHEWQVPPQSNGFYRVRAVVDSAGEVVLDQRTTFVVMDPISAVPQGEFGWSLSSGAGEMSLLDVATIAEHAAVNWIKLPLWSASHADQKARSSEISVFIDSLEHKGITLVGILNDPPPQVTEKFAQHWVGVSKIFTMPRDFWYPSLEPLIARYSFRIRHWQLGDEHDDSFVGLPSLSKTIAAVKREFDRIGHDCMIGCHWDWKQPLPESRDVRDCFLSLSTRPDLTSEQLETALNQAKSCSAPRWVLLDPLPNSGNSAVDRAADLARRVVAAKRGQAEAVFISNPLDPLRGLLNADGSPTELFLPWRTLASVLRGAQYLGGFEMPAFSPNAVFSRNGEVLMIVWNDRPTREELYLGEEVEIIDLWGRRRPARRDPQTGRQRLDVGPMPLIVAGCSDAVARWRLALQFEKGVLRSEYGAHEEAVLLVNTFPQGISGRAVLHMPPDWETEPNHWTFQAAAGEKLRLPTQVVFPPDAPLGKLRPRLDFEIAADRAYQFTTFLPYQLGLGDVELLVTSRKTNEGRLEVVQKIINNTEPLETLNFNCSLFIPGQIRQKQIVTKLGKGEDKRFYYVLDAEDLKGQRLWLRVEQIDGRRVLNYHWTLPE